LSPKNKKIIKIIKNIKKRCKYFDIAPPATMCFIPKNENYYTLPPPNCCRFFIENRQCFLRERDNACICPISRTVIGFWNEKVGKECKLLPIEDETTYEEACVNQTLPEVPVVPEVQVPVRMHSNPDPRPKSPTTPKSPKISNCNIISKPKIVSDAQRARIASEPVALLREKLATKYGMTKRN
jgi:hypothetical protein